MARRDDLPRFRGQPAGLRGYDGVLETFSKPRLDPIDWRWTPERESVAANDTGGHYRYFDATDLAE
jgi:hypothetical protein